MLFDTHVQIKSFLKFVISHGRSEVIGDVYKTTTAFTNFHFHLFPFTHLDHTKKTNGQVIVDSEIKGFCFEVFDDGP